MNVGHSHSYQVFRVTSSNVNEEFVVEGVELTKAEEISGEKEESSGQFIFDEDTAL